jgi:transposase
VRLIPAQYVKPFLKGHKNDYRDAEAIAEAVQRPTMRFAGTKRRTAASHNSVAIRGIADMPRTRPARRSDAFDPQPT